MLSSKRVAGVMSSSTPVSDGDSWLAEGLRLLHRRGLLVPLRPAARFPGLTRPPFPDPFESENTSERPLLWPNSEVSSD